MKIKFKRGDIVRIIEQNTKLLRFKRFKISCIVTTAKDQQPRYLIESIDSPKIRMRWREESLEYYDKMFDPKRTKKINKI